MNGTRQRLLESACEIFAEKGFHDANVADICERAHANIAAINYHFGGKQKLYEETIDFAEEVAQRECPLEQDPAVVPEPKERLWGFIRAQFLRNESTGPVSCIDRIVVHEMTNPSASHEKLFRHVLRKRRDYLFALMRELLPPGASEECVRVSTFHVVSLFAFRRFMGKPPKHHGKGKGPSAEVKAHHATVFALGGIRAIAELPDLDSPGPGCLRQDEEKSQ